MPRNKFGGNKAKKGKNHRPPPQLILKRDVPGALYGSVVSNLGNGACMITILEQSDAIVKTIRCLIRGSVRRQRFMKGDIVLICQSELTLNGDYIYNIIYKYNQDHISQLYYRGEIIQSAASTAKGIIFEKNTIHDELDEDNEITDFERLALIEEYGTYTNPIPDSDSDECDELDECDKSNELDSLENHNLSKKSINEFNENSENITWDAYVEKPKERMMKKSEQKKINAVGAKKGKMINQTMRNKKEDEQTSDFNLTAVWDDI